MELKQSLQ